MDVRCSLSFLKLVQFGIFFLVRVMILFSNVNLCLRLVCYTSIFPIYTRLPVCYKSSYASIIYVFNHNHISHHHVSCQTAQASVTHQGFKRVLINSNNVYISPSYTIRNQFYLIILSLLPLIFAAITMLSEYR